MTLVSPDDFKSNFAFPEINGHLTFCSFVNRESRRDRKGKRVTILPLNFLIMYGGKFRCKKLLQSWDPVVRLGLYIDFKNCSV